MSTKSEFSWSRFDPESLESFARVFQYDGPREHFVRSEWLGKRFQQPTNEFVSKAFHAIQNIWFRRNEAVATGVVDAFVRNGIGPREKPRTHVERMRFLSQSQNRSLVRKYYQKALLKFGANDSWSEGDEFVLETNVPRFSILKPIEQPSDFRDPFDYQLKAWDELNLQLSLAETSGVFEGFLVMPTGSGKTFTSARWLTENHVNNGGRILWLAHRHELLEQAAEAFQRCSALADQLNELRIRIVSGSHCPTSSLGPDDNIMCCSVQSLARNPDVVSEIIDDPSVFLVVDEAHHASAKSYREMIEKLRAKDSFKLLGLTATPTRTIVHEQPILSRLFGHKRIFEIETRGLIERGYLARPIPVVVETDFDMESGATAEDYQHLQSFNELSEAWKSRIANLTERNEAITKHYLGNRAKYEKTLIFAINIPHAELLCERLRDAGVESDYVASYRLNGSAYDKREIIDRFRDPNSGLDVLVNVMILTEGVDIPNVKTVFLTRPVRSEILLRQMVGRALRGPSAGGTEEAYLVSFEDRWEEFDEWERPLDLLQDLLDVEVDEEIAEEDAYQQLHREPLAEVIPWELLRRTSIEIRRIAKFGDVSSFEAVPSGWYVLENENDEDITTTLVPVYQHQQNCWEALLANLEGNSGMSKLESPEEIRDEYFYDCDNPRAATHHIDGVVSSTLNDGERPEFRPFGEREQSDPKLIATEIWEDQLRPMEIDRLLSQKYELPLSKAIFDTFEEFRDLVQSELNNLTSEKTGRIPSLGQVQFEPWSNHQLSPGPYHKLENVLTEVLSIGSGIQSIGSSLPWQGVINWTRRPIKGWFGKAEWEETSAKGEGAIRINCLLDSPDVSLETLQFLVWHEYLHLFLQCKHTPLFRKLEKKWPGSREAERELDTLIERFEIPFWW